MLVTLDEYKKPIPPLKAKRINCLKEEFINLYGLKPDFFTRTPGRVNIIGEHIDYSGYGVLPLAIDCDIIIAASKRIDNTLKLGNLNALLYNPITIDLGTNKQLGNDCINVQNYDVDYIMVHSQSPKWHDYFLAGFKGAMIKIKEMSGIKSSLGMNILISSTLPACSGLSSSSALVCAASLSALMVHEIYLTRLEMAQLCASSERYIGTYGGGMDQAICFLSEEHQATLINFDPVRARAVKIPEGCQFVIANSCAPMDKGNTPNYNIRVCECRIAAQILFKEFVEADNFAVAGGDRDWKLIDNIKQMQNLLGIEKLPELGDLFKQFLKSEPYEKEQIMEVLEVESDAEFVEHCLRNKILPDGQRFKLLDRALHVCGEAQRVLDFTRICDNFVRDGHLGGEEKTLAQMGRLMNESHQSCRDLFECSHPKLDELVGICRENGALGSRLTGAGWGGCCVSLVPKEDVPKFIEKVSGQFYKREHNVGDFNHCTASNGGAACNGNDKNVSDMRIFSSHPSSGACVYFD